MIKRAAEQAALARAALGRLAHAQHSVERWPESKPTRAYWDRTAIDTLAVVEDAINALRELQYELAQTVAGDDAA